VLGPDEDDDALVADLVVRVLVNAEVFLGHGVYEVQVGVLLDALHYPPHLEETVGVLGINDRERQARLPVYVTVLLSGLGLAALDVLAVSAEPDGIVVQLTIRPKGRDVGEGRAAEQVLVALGNKILVVPCRHSFSFS
jgi:hypothetical protein